MILTKTTNLRIKLPAAIRPQDKPEHEEKDNYLKHKGGNERVIVT